MVNAYDAIVIGGGHNGLVAGAYLAKAGARAVVLEARHKTGGAAATDSPWPEAPEFKVTTYSYVMSLMPDTIIRDLDLNRHGYKVYPMGPYFQAWPDGRSLMLFADDAKRNYDQVAKFSKKDAEAMPRWDAWLGDLAKVMGPLLMTVPPKLGSMKPADLIAQAQLGWKLRGLGPRKVGDLTRLMTMSITDLLGDWFESEEVKASLAVNGIIGTWAGPDGPGTAYVMAHHSIGDVGDGHLGNWGFAEGGMGAVADACRRSAEELGATIRTNARVQQVLIRNGEAEGVVLDNGEELRAPVVVTACHPKVTFLKQIDRKELPAEFVRDIENWKCRSGVVKINLALAELPKFKAGPTNGGDEHLTGSVELCLSTDYAETAFQEARSGIPATRPFVDGVIPTLFDKTLAPEGKHIFSMFTQYVPHEWSEAPYREELEAYADRVIDCYTELAPNLKSSILHRQVIGPYDMEQELGLIGGNIFHGELSVDQLFHMRPAPGYADFRTPIHGLYQASSACHAGGGVCGVPAYLAVKQILGDRKLKRSGAKAS
ncbi:MAG TPA: NAD(P)/FAD-dependent oxidoreductase [Candidatus Acidoferrum sp.]|jgi:phytoene dehydrogenase-like protein|nr:NAD(P)/FAD-dependent oxidoreductase [Candidatus Acidoferrum sp.]